MNLPVRNQYLLLPDEELLKHCRCDCYLGSGPGGQHRNRNYTGVRVTLLDDPELSAADETERSQLANRRKALQKLRMKLALTCRKDPAEPLVFEHVSENNVTFPLMLAEMLDVIAATGFDHKISAKRLGISNSKLLKELYRVPEAWSWFQNERRKRDLPELKVPR